MGKAIVGYRIFGVFSKDPNDLLVAAAKEGFVTEYYCSYHCDLVWFNGFPGKQLRKLRDQIKARIVQIIEPAY